MTNYTHFVHREIQYKANSWEQRSFSKNLKTLQLLLRFPLIIVNMIVLQEENIIIKFATTLFDLVDILCDLSIYEVTPYCACQVCNTSCKLCYSSKNVNDYVYCDVT